MAKNAQGIEVPAGSDPFDPQGDMVELAESLEGRLVMPVPNATARGELLSAIGSTNDDPLIVRQGDTGTYWEHTPATGWRAFAGINFLAQKGTVNTGAISAGGNSGPFSVDFTRPYPTAPTVIINHDSGRVLPYQKVVSATGFTFRLFNVTSGALASGSVDWVAVP